MTDTSNEHQASLQFMEGSQKHGAGPGAEGRTGRPVILTSVLASRAAEKSAGGLELPLGRRFNCGFIAGLR